MARMRRIGLLAAVGVLLASPATAAPREERVAFARGASSTELRGTVRGYDYVDYLVGARAGQSMRVTLHRESGSANFLVRAPGSEDNLFDGSINGDEFAGTLPADGDYRIRIFLMRAFARRNESSRYRLTIEIR